MQGAREVALRALADHRTQRRCCTCLVYRLPDPPVNRFKSFRDGSGLSFGRHCIARVFAQCVSWRAFFLGAFSCLFHVRFGTISSPIARSAPPPHTLHRSLRSTTQPAPAAANRSRFPPPCTHIYLKQFTADRSTALSPTSWRHLLINL